MQGGDLESGTAFSAPVKRSIIVVVLGVTGLLTIMQWTATTVRRHARIASHSLFPAALKSQEATAAFQRMNREYSDAVVIQKKASLAIADQDAAAVVSTLDGASTFMEFNSGRHEQIVSLIRRVSALQKRSRVCYAAAAAATDVDGNLPNEIEAELVDLGHENKAVQTVLEALQSDLANDFRAELALIDKLLRIQGLLETALLISVVATLFFSARALIDTIARRRGDAVLRQAHKDTEILLNSVPSLLIGLDASGHIQRWNKAATTILGWQEDAVFGKTLDECGVNWLTANLNARVAARVQNASSDRLDDIRLNKNGMTRFVGLSAIRLDTDGAVGSLVVGADITERLTLEGQLRQAQKLESIGQLAAGIAHEINTPTQYIGDNVRFLKDAFGDLNELQANYDRLLATAKDHTLSDKIVQEVAAAVERADVNYLREEIPKSIEQSLEGVARVAKLVGAMKDFSHPGTKDKVLLDLNRAIESTITVARNEWKYVAEMETDYDSSLPSVLCLPAEFNQVILILIVNAAHAIADVVGEGNSGKGKIKVQTRNCAGWCEIRIQDTGTGIPEQVRSRIFDPFFTTKEIGKGTGQGLTIARSVVVDKHGGTIHFETEEGKGTTFIIRLPLSDKAVAAKGAPV